MTKITKKARFVEIDQNLDNKKQRKCLYCEKYGFDSILTRRPNYEEIDKDQWLYCRNCKRSFLQRETRMEGRLKSAVDVQMYEDEKTIMGLDNLEPRDPYKKAIKKRLQEERDPDVRALIKQGLDPQDAIS